jgi:hypothetical protein
VYAAAAAFVGLALSTAGVVAWADNQAQSAIPPDKAALAQREVSQASAQPHPDKKAGAAQAAAAAAAAPVTDAHTAGINDEMHQGPFGSADFVVSNFYEGPVGGSWYLVYAGTTKSGQGGLRVMSETPAGVITLVGDYVLPKGMTSVRVTQFAGTVLTVQDVQGAMATFDLATKVFRVS